MKKQPPESNKFDPLSGKTPKVPWFWIGTWSMGGEGFGPHDESESRKVLEIAYENGIVHYDTAAFYAHGKSEALLAKVFTECRKDIFISTKGGLEWKGNAVIHDASPKALREALHKSLENLNTDYIDLFQLHWPDPKVPIKDSLDTLKEFQKEGLIRHWGVGNLSANEVRDNIPTDMDVPHQVHFNPVHPAEDILKEGKKDNKCWNCVISPLEQGLLSSSTYSLGKKDIRRKNTHFYDKSIPKKLEKLFQNYEGFNLSRESLVLLWILSHEEVDVVIPGPRRVSQFEQLLSVVRWTHEAPDSWLPGAFVNKD